MSGIENGQNNRLMSDADVIDRVFHHIDNKTTDLGDRVWREPVANYTSQAQFEAEIAMMRRVPMVYCPSAALPEAGSFIARESAGTPLLVVRGEDGVVRAFRNACRHRGMKLADGEGCTRALNCTYHNWTYGLDGKLLHIPGEAAFPGIDKDQHGLVPVHGVEERGGLVFVTQEEPLSEGALDGLPEIIKPNQQIFESTEFTDPANWKVLIETAMEGYHIKPLHGKTFYPYGFDNLNVVETYGCNARIVFPFRRIEKLRDVPRDERVAEGMLTYVYHLFPNTRVSVLSSHYQLVITEPLSPSESRWVVYRLSRDAENMSEAELDEAKRDAAFVRDTGVIEDRAAACAIQNGMQSGANTHFTFGRNENVAVNFHDQLDRHLTMLAG